MARYHLNYKGEPGVCRAAHACPFGDIEKDHFSSPEEARGAYEEQMVQYLSGESVSKKESEPEAPAPAAQAIPARPDYPIEGDYVRISHSAGAELSSNEKHVGKVGLVKEFTGSSYDVEMPSGETINVHWNSVTATESPKPTIREKNIQARAEQARSFDGMASSDLLKPAMAEGLSKFYEGVKAQAAKGTPGAQEAATTVLSATARALRAHGAYSSTVMNRVDDLAQDFSHAQWTEASKGWGKPDRIKASRKYENFPVILLGADRTRASTSGSAYSSKNGGKR